MSNLIKDTCKALGITQKELAKQMGVHEMTVSQWARGVKDLPIWASKLMNLMRRESASIELAEKVTELVELAKLIKK